MRRFNLVSGNDGDTIATINNTAVLCILSTKMWGTPKKIDPEKLLSSGMRNKKDFIGANKKVINKEVLADIQAKITKARNTIKSYALPFPLEGFHMVPKPKAEELAKKLDDIILEMKPLVDTIVENWPEIISNAEEMLGPELFEKSDYPSVHEIRKRFGIAYRFIEIGVPGEFKAVSPEIYQAEMIKFRQTMEEARNECIIFLRQAFVKELEEMVETLMGESEDGKAKRIRTDTLEKVENFFNMFQSKNIFKDQELLKEIENARNILTGIEASDLRKSDKLKELIIDQIAKVADTVESGIIKYRRKISLQ